jgi:hypothetical protein
MERHVHALSKGHTLTSLAALYIPHAYVCRIGSERGKLTRPKQDMYRCQSWDDISISSGITVNKSREQRTLLRHRCRQQENLEEHKGSFGESQTKGPEQRQCHLEARSGLTASV